MQGSDEDAAAASRLAEEKLTKLLARTILLVPAVGLLFALLINKPGLNELDGEPALSLEDLRRMFLDMTLPAGWDTWKKRRVDWTLHTTGLLVTAAKEYHTKARSAS